MALPPSRSRSLLNNSRRLPSYHVSLGGGGGGSHSLSPSPSRTVSRLSFFLGTILVSALLALVTVAITLGGLPADRWHARRLLREHDPNAEVFEPNRRALKTHHDSDEGEYHSLAFQALNESAASSVPKEDLNLPHEGRLWERYNKLNRTGEKGVAYMDHINWESRLRTYLFAGSDTSVPYDPKTTPGSPALVGVAVYLLKLDHITPKTGSMIMSAWIQLTWYDPRLRWNVSEWGGVKKFQQSIVATTPNDGDIWFPDFELYESTPGLGPSLSHQFATVRNDGLVYYSRNGNVRIICDFHGLTNFPFDDLKCDFSGGGWSRGGDQVNYVLIDTGVGANARRGFGVARLALEDRFFDFHVTDFGVSTLDTTYVTQPGVVWPTFIYELRLRRAVFGIVMSYVFPNCILGFLTLFVYLIDLSSGERIGYAITLMLALIASNIVTNDMIPQTNHMLWSDMFNITIMVFSCFSIIQTVLAMQLYYASLETKPKWLDRLARLFRVRHLLVEDEDITSWVGKYDIKNVRAQLKTLTKKISNKTFPRQGSYKNARVAPITNEDLESEKAKMIQRLWRGTRARAAYQAKVDEALEAEEDRSKYLHQHGLTELSVQISRAFDTVSLMIIAPAYFVTITVLLVIGSRRMLGESTDVFADVSYQESPSP